METAAPSAAPSAPAAAPSSAPAAPSQPTAARIVSPTPTPEKAPETGGPPSEATPPPAKPEPRRFKVKVDGQEQEVDEEELQRGYMRAKAATQRFEEAAKLRKEIEERQAAEKKRYEDPRVRQVKDAALQLGQDLSDEDAWALMKAWEFEQKKAMTPEQRALADERAKREELEQKLKAEEESKKTAALEAETKAEATKLDRELTAAAAKLGIPKSPAWGRAMLDHMAAVARAGGVPDPEEAAIYVKEHAQRSDRERLAALSDDQLVSWIGDDVYKRILRHSIAKAKGSAPVAQPPAPPPPTPEKPPQYLTPDEWRKRYA